MSCRDVPAGELGPTALTFCRRTHAAWWTSAGSPHPSGKSFKIAIDDGDEPHVKHVPPKSSGSFGDPLCGMVD